MQFKFRWLELWLLIVATAVVTLMLFTFESSQGRTWTNDMWWLIGGFGGAFFVVHIFLCALAPYADQVLLPVASVLNGIGLLVIYRLDTANNTHLASRQLMWTAASLVLLLLTLVAVRDHRRLSRYSYLLGVVGLFLLALPLVWPQPADSDARIWISVGPFSIQPGEFSKILLLLFFAQLLASKRSLFTVAGYRFLGLQLPRLRDLAPILVVWAIAILIMAATNDFGPALLLFSTVLTMIYMATNRLSWLLIGVVLVAVGGTAVYQISPKIQTRVANFRDPVGNIDTSYQLAQSLFGMSWGGLLGTGLGKGHPDLVPVAHADFILAAVGEEIGFVGLSAVLVLFAILISRGFRAALRVRDSYGKLLAAGLAMTMTIQIFVVTAGISALMPMTGLTTPFMSAGGSSLMANYILVAIILRISNDSRRPSAVEDTLSYSRLSDSAATGHFPAAQEVSAR